MHAHTHAHTHTHEEQNGREEIAEGNPLIHNSFENKLEPQISEQENTK